jgi:pimeloyl-ACP methyl ester carboxylesterase
MLSSGVVRSGSARGIPFDDLNAVQLFGSTQIPILILHSPDDGYVPIQAADRLARLSRHVTLERFAGARHVKLWNANRARYERVVNNWLDNVLSPTEPSTTKN